MSTSPTSSPDATTPRRKRRRRTGTDPHLAPADAPRHGGTAMRARRRPALPDRTGLLAMAMLAIALVAGGGGTSNPTAELVIELTMPLLAIGALVIGPAQNASRPAAHLAPLHAIAALVLVMPVVQLVPLPPGLWHTLPGRAMERASLALIGRDNAWMPISMEPARTVAALIGCVPPLLMMLVAARLGLRARQWLLGTIMAVASASLVVGALQINRTGGLGWSWFTQHHQGFLIGFFANHNAQADLLLIAIVVAAALTVPLVEGRRRTAVAWSGWVIAELALLAATFATGSRTGIALSALAVTLAVAMLWRPIARRIRRPGLWLAVIAPITGGAIWLAVQTPQLQRALERFSVDREDRWTIWRTSRQLLGQLWPWGGGVGTFRELYDAIEPLDTVGESFAGRAHCDWLEWAIEAGVPGLIVLAAILVLLAAALARGFLRSRGLPMARAQWLAGIGMMALIGLHAIDDFPVRSMALATLLALGAALAGAIPVPKARDPHAAHAAHDDSGAPDPCPDITA